MAALAWLLTPLSRSFTMVAMSEVIELSHLSDISEITSKAAILM